MFKVVLVTIGWFVGTQLYFFTGSVLLFLFPYCLHPFRCSLLWFVGSILPILGYLVGYFILWRMVARRVRRNILPTVDVKILFILFSLPLIFTVGMFALNMTKKIIYSTQSDKDEKEFENAVFATSPKVILRTTSSNEGLALLSFQWTFHLDESIARRRSTFISDTYNFIPPEVDRDCWEYSQEKRALKTPSGDKIVDSQSSFNEIWSSSLLAPGGYNWEVTYLVGDMGNQYLEKCSLESISRELSGQTIIVQKQPPIRTIKTFTIGKVEVEK